MGRFQGDEMPRMIEWERYLMDWTGQGTRRLRRILPSHGRRERRQIEVCTPFRIRLWMRMIANYTGIATTGKNLFWQQVAWPAGCKVWQVPKVNTRKISHKRMRNRVIHRDNELKNCLTWPSPPSCPTWAGPSCALPPSRPPARPCPASASSSFPTSAETPSGCGPAPSPRRKWSVCPT